MALLLRLLHQLEGVVTRIMAAQTLPTKEVAAAAGAPGIAAATVVEVATTTIPTAIAVTTGLQRPSHLTTTTLLLRHTRSMPLKPTEPLMLRLAIRRPNLTGLPSTPTLMPTPTHSLPIRMLMVQSP
jgi:hypothetical protein